MTEIPYSFYFHQFPDTNFRSLVEMIKKSDFLVSDEQGTHRLCGLKYDRNIMIYPQVCCIIWHRDVGVAAKLAMILGKKIFAQNDLSARIFKRYCIGETLSDYDDLIEVAQLYAKYYGTERNHQNKLRFFDNIYSQYEN